MKIVTILFILFFLFSCSSNNWENISDENVATQVSENTNTVTISEDDNEFISTPSKDLEDTNISLNESLWEE